MVTPFQVAFIRGSFRVPPRMLTAAPLPWVDETRPDVVPVAASRHRLGAARTPRRAAARASTAPLRGRHVHGARRFGAATSSSCRKASRPSRCRSRDDAARLHAGPRRLRARHAHERPGPAARLHRAVSGPASPLERAQVLELVLAGRPAAGDGEPAVPPVSPGEVGDCARVPIPTACSSPACRPAAPMAAILGREYPDVFAASAVHSGLPRARPATWPPPSP